MQITRICVDSARVDFKLEHYREYTRLRLDVEVAFAMVAEVPTIPRRKKHA